MVLGTLVALLTMTSWHLTPHSARAQVQNQAHTQSVLSEHVIFISIDGLRSDAITNLGPTHVPAIFRLMNEGASTLNARNDPDYTITLPNHTSMLTGRFVSGTNGHSWTKNTDPSAGETIHNNAGKYVSSVFDVAHNEGLKTGLFATKSKFEIFFNSWDSNNGAPDPALPDYGRAKIDASGFEGSSMEVVQAFIQSSATGDFNFSFLHFYDPDHVGHTSGWDPQIGSVYTAAVMDADAALGALLSYIDSSASYKGKTSIILTADHGGIDFGHSDAQNVINYTIPFVAWGKSVEAGRDFYALNPSSRQDPGSAHIPRSFTGIPPIRNADGGNLALSMLGLPSIPGSTINPQQDLSTGTPVVDPIQHVAFQDGVSPSTDYEGTRDTKIISTDPNTVYGDHPVLEIDAESDYGVLLSWDLMSIPTNATVTGAAFVFDVTDVTVLDYEYYEVTRWWEEETATWNRANSGANWQTPGALGAEDHNSTVLGTITGSTQGAYTYPLNDKALAVVQKWIREPGSNYGFIFQDYTSGDDGLDFSSREASDPAKRPRLELTYTMDPGKAPQASVANFTMTLSRVGGGVVLAADASTSSDSNGRIVSYAWDFGDGSTGSGLQLSHTYATAGTYRVVLTITDDTGETNQFARLVIVDAPGANTLAFQQGAAPSVSYDGARDTKLLSESPATNFGSVDFLEVDGSPKDVILAKWDVSAIPPGVTVTAASMVVDVVNASVQDYGVYGLLKDWNEQQATWELASTGVPWETVGGAGSTDFSPLRLAKAGPSQVEKHTMALNASGLALLTRWINNPSSNYGLVIRDYANAQDGLDFASREAALASRRPRLEITYTNAPIAPPPDTTKGNPPVAAFEMTLVRDNGAVVASMDATTSSADSPLTYAWTFDASEAGSATGVTASYSFHQVGTHTVTLFVTDEKGATNSMTRPVLVDVHSENQAGFQDGVAPIAGYFGTNDSKILSSSKTSNYGSDLVLEVDGSPQNATMIKWDLGAIAPGVDVLEVTLHFEVLDASNEVYGIFGLVRPWEEKASTWMEAAKGFTWQLDGASGENDFHPERFGELGPVPLGPTSVKLNQAGLDWVESWINHPESNDGFLFRDYASSQDGLDLASREVALASSRPRIDIRYQSQHNAELPQKLRIGAYPNPFTDELTIDLANSVSHDVRLELYDMLGRRVTYRTLGAGEISGPIRLNTASLVAGVYALRVTEHGTIVSTTKLVTKGY